MERVPVSRRGALAGLTAVAAAGLVAAAGCRSDQDSLAGDPAPAGSAPASGPPSSAAAPDSPSPTPVPSRTAGVPARTPSAAPSSPASSPSPSKPGPLRVGSSGSAVRGLQERLTALGYWAGTVDGNFGGQTEQAVFALQKAAKISPDGAVGPATQRALDAGTRPTARSTSGRLIEVSLSRGLLLFVTNGHVNYTLNTSTGGGYVYYDNGEREVATTPKGHFKTYRVIDGPHTSSLGLLIRPRYFTGGYAIHGDTYVPAKPVSHGCVRVTEAAIDWIWAGNLDPIGTPVWVY